MVLDRIYGGRALRIAVGITALVLLTAGTASAYPEFVSATATSDTNIDIVFNEAISVNGTPDWGYAVTATGLTATDGVADGSTLHVTVNSLGNTSYTASDLAIAADTVVDSNSDPNFGIFGQSIADGQAPTLSSWTLDMNAGTASLTFSEPVKASTLDVTGITIQDAAIAGTSYTLTDSTTASGDGSVIVVDLSATDLNAIKANAGLAKAIGTSYITITSAVIQDMAANAVTAIADGSGLQAGAYTADTTAPTLTFVRIVSNNSNPTLAKVGDRINVSMTADEALNATPTVTIAGNSATVTSTGGNSYNATYTMQSGDAEGTVAFTIDFADAAGNAGTQVTTTTDASSVAFDKTAPSVTSNTNNVYVANNTLLNLSAIIIDSGSGVHNATVNVSLINQTLTQVNLINQSSSNFWNATILADKVTNGFVNLTITAYDNASNVNNSLNMTVQVTATGAPVIIDSCRTISSPGEYVLTTTINNASTCIKITSSNVILDGAGYTINGTKMSGTYGVYVHNSTPLSNVTVTNLSVTNWSTGIYLQSSSNNNLTGNTANWNRNYGIWLSSSSNNNLTGNTANSNNCGIYLIFSSNNTLTSNNASSNTNYGIFLYSSSNSNTLTGNTANWNKNYGIWLYSSNNNLTGNNASSNTNYGIYLFLFSDNNLTGNTASSNPYGIYLYSSSSNNLTNNNASNNTLWAFYSASNSINNTVTNLTINPTISFTGKDVAIKSTASPASDPDGYKNISKFINTTNNSADSWLFLNISYSNSDVSGLNESTLRMWRYNGSAWSPVPDPNNVDTGQKYVYANITVFSIFAPMAIPTFNISGYKNDTNGNGIPGWNITLYNATLGGYITNNITDATGFYQFQNLDPGEYNVTEVMQNGWKNVTPVSQNVTISSGDMPDQNFTNQKLFNISGYKINDTNGNGVSDSGEKGIEGWNIALKNATGNLINTTATNSAGFYQFTNIAEGSYNVTEEDRAGWNHTNATSRAIILSQNITNLNFTNRRVFSVNTSTGTGTVYLVTDAGTIQNLISVNESRLPAAGKPNSQFPQGFLSFNITGLNPGQTVNVTIVFPSNIPINAQYWKYQTPGGWYEVPIGSNDGDNIIIIQFQDGGIGDDIGIPDGKIVDPGGVGLPNTLPAPVPALNPAGLVALAGALSFVAIGRIRRRGK